MEILESAKGDCVVCGKDAEGSVYWTPLPTAIWNAVRPYLAPLFSDRDHIQNVLFFPEHSDPFCGPTCAQRYNSNEAEPTSNK